MESYIKISTLNDFIFCPRSIYFHGLYEDYRQTLYHRKPQTKGKLKHDNIDAKKYSTEKKYLQSLEIFSEKYKLCGKIDIYDAETKTLVERKSKITTIYDGYKYQLYAQYFCMQEMGYEVDHLCFYSFDENKKYPIDLPTKKDIGDFEKLLEQMRSFDILNQNFQQNPEKCKTCIYFNLCDVGNF